MIKYNPRLLNNISKRSSLGKLNEWKTNSNNSEEQCNFNDFNVEDDLDIPITSVKAALTERKKEPTFILGCKRDAFNDTNEESTPNSYKTPSVMSNSHPNSNKARIKIFPIFKNSKIIIKSKPLLSNIAKVIPKPVKLLQIRSQRNFNSLIKENSIGKVTKSNCAMDKPVRNDLSQKAAKTKRSYSRNTPIEQLVSKISANFVEIANMTHTLYHTPKKKPVLNSKPINSLGNTVVEFTHDATNEYLWRTMPMSSAIKYLADINEVKTHFIEKLILMYYSLSVSDSTFLSQSMEDAFTFAKIGLKNYSSAQQYLNNFLVKKGDPQRQLIYDAIAPISYRFINFNQFIQLVLLVKYKRPSKRLALVFLSQILNLRGDGLICKNEILQRIKFFYLFPMTMNALKELGEVHEQISRYMLHNQTDQIEKRALYNAINKDVSLCKRLLSIILE